MTRKGRGGRRHHGSNGPADVGRAPQGMLRPGLAAFRLRGGGAAGGLDGGQCGGGAGGEAGLDLGEGGAGAGGELGLNARERGLGGGEGFLRGGLELAELGGGVLDLGGGGSELLALDGAEGGEVLLQFLALLVALGVELRLQRGDLGPELLRQ